MNNKTEEIALGGHSSNSNSRHRSMQSLNSLQAGFVVKINLSRKISSNKIEVVKVNPKISTLAHSVEDHSGNSVRMKKD